MENVTFNDGHLMCGIVRVIEPEDYASKVVRVREKVIKLCRMDRCVFLEVAQPKQFLMIRFQVLYLHLSDTFLSMSSVFFRNRI